MDYYTFCPGKSLLFFLTLFPRSEERVDQRSVVGVSNRRNV
jgi:hypothetical protein